MKKGLLTTLFAAAVSFAGTTAAFAAAPVIGTIPDLQIGDMEDNPAGGSDNNYFVYTNAFQFSAKVSDTDTPAGSLLWSFAEYHDAGGLAAPVSYSDTTPQYQINGKAPIYTGFTAISGAAPGYLAAKPVSAGGTLTTGTAINGASDWASFRDVLFSPTNQTAPFTPSVTANQSAWSGSNGKKVVFYVSDPEGNLDEDIVQVKTKDNAFDAQSTSWSPIINATSFTGWSQSGLNSTAVDPTQQPGGGAAFDDVDITPASPSTGQAEIGTIVRASSGRYRILGWTYTPGIAYPGAGSYVRGKFYIYTNNAAADAVNKYPNFRARLQHGGAVVGVTNYSYAATGNTGGTGGNFPYASTDNPAIETEAGQYLKPSRTALKPSLYRVDFDPVDVPAAGALPIIPTFESFAFNDPAAATIMLTQCTVGTFPALSDAQGTLIGKSYTRAATAASQGFSSTPVAGSGETPGIVMAGFNAEGNFTPGYKQNVFLVTAPVAAVGTEVVGNTGLMIDTLGTNTDYTSRFVVGIIDLMPNLNVDRPRIAPGKYYRARFYATSDVQTTAAASGTQRQANVRFRVQAAKAVVNCYQEFVGAQPTLRNTSSGTVGSPENNAYRDNVVAGQALPGTNSANPDTDPTLTPAGYDGGWYTVLMPTPLDGDIRRDVDNTGTVSATTFGTLFSAPATGSASNSPKDIKAGVDVYTNPLNLVINGVTFNGIYDANRAKVALTAVKIYEHNAADVTDDGGYGY